MVGIYFAFQAKLNPNIDDPMPLYAPEIEQTFIELAKASKSLEDAARIMQRKPEQICKVSVRLGVSFKTAKKKK